VAIAKKLQLEGHPIDVAPVLGFNIYTSLFTQSVATKKW